MDNPELFIISSVTFEQGKDDPFGFDDLTEKVGGAYVPFSGSIKLIRYLVFIPLVSQLVNEFKISNREKRGAKRRLEKLLVYLAKYKYKVGKRSYLMGISLKNINPFDSSSGWVVNDCFKLYPASVDSLSLNDEDFEKILKKVYFKPKFIKFVREFLNRQGSMNSNERWLEKQEPNLKGSIFDLTKPVDNRLIRYISEKIFDSKKTKRLTDVYPYLNKKPDKYIKLIKENPNFPFKALNQFLKETINAIKNDIEGNKDNLWNKAYNSLKILQSKYKESLKKPFKDSDRISKWKDASSPNQLIYGLIKASEENVGGWFKEDAHSKRFSKGNNFPENYNYLENKSKGEYSDFRLDALELIIEDINNRGIK